MYIVDRFEGIYAVCEDESGKMIDIPIDLLPNSVAEGDCICNKDGLYVIDEAFSQKKKCDLEARLKRMSFRS